MMADRLALHERARAFFDDLWKQGDPWEFESSEFEQQKYRRQIELLGDRHYDRVLEIGCGTGVFTRELTVFAGSILAIDVSQVAITAARKRSRSVPAIEFRTENVMQYDPPREGPYDLIVLSDTIYYVGWLYPFFDVAWLAHRLYEASRSGARLLLANTCGDPRDKLLLPWIIRTYHDLFVNVGYTIERQDILRGTKSGVDLETPMTLFLKP
jgi:SAM-dependent methyltransferase